MLSVVTPPASYPITVEEAAYHMRIIAPDADETTYIQGLIATATSLAENYMRGIACVSQTLDLFLDVFPDIIRLPKNPVQSITFVKYFDSNGDEQTLDETLYSIDTESWPARIVPAYEQTWPETRAVLNAITVRFIAGFDTIPDNIKAAIKIIVAELYENREQTSQSIYKLHDVSLNAQALLNQTMLYEF